LEPQLLDGKGFGAFLIVEVPGGKDEYGYVEGTARWDGLRLSIIGLSEGEPPFPIPAHTYDRIRPVDEKMRLVFKTAEFYVPLVIQPLAEGADRSDFIETGHRWPPAPDA
jgi:hypothetical protein